MVSPADKEDGPVPGLLRWAHVEDSCPRSGMFINMEYILIYNLLFLQVLYLNF